MEIKATKKFTDLAFKTTATLAKGGYSTEATTAIGLRIEKIGRDFVGREYTDDYKIIRFDALYDVIVDIGVKFKNGTMTAVNCTVCDGEKPIVIFPSLTV
jgi:hypothetical protein